MKAHAYESKLQQLETEHATEGQLLDIKRSDALATEENELERGYFYSFKTIGSVASISLSTTASYWAFSPAAAVLTVINADIGRLTVQNHWNRAYNVFQAQPIIPVYLPSSGPPVSRSRFCYLVEYQTNSEDDGS
jgi:hypothetical protein